MSDVKSRVHAELKRVDGGRGGASAFATTYYEPQKRKKNQYYKVTTVNESND